MSPQQAQRLLNEVRQARREQAEARYSTQPLSKSMLRRLETLEQDWSGHQDFSHAGTGQARWMIPYADLMTLLLGLFLVLFAFAYMKQEAYKQEAETLRHKLQVELKKHPPVKKVATKMMAQSPKIQELEKNLKTKLALSKGLQVRQTPQGIVISLTDNVLFAPGSAELAVGAQKKLDTIAQVLKDVHRPIRVEGHTDKTPISTAKYPSNWELSTARATNIIQFMVSRHHFPPQQLSAAGYGEFHPIADNSSIEGKQKNRRVDIVLVGDSQPQAQ